MKKIILIILLIPILIFTYIVIITNNNNQYQEKNIKELQEKLSLKNIKTYNYYNYTYTIITDTEIIVVDDNYQIKLRLSKDDINIDNCHIIYKNNKLVCEEKIYEKYKITYNYRDAYTNELISTISIKEGL